MDRYNSKMRAAEQISAEEDIATALFDRCGIDEELAAGLGRELLRLVLQKFRPDLFDGAPRPAILFAGNLSEGFRAVGPFLEGREAIEDTQEGWVMELSEPVRYTDEHVHDHVKCCECGSKKHCCCDCPAFGGPADDSGPDVYNSDGEYNK